MTLLRLSFAHIPPRTKVPRPMDNHERRAAFRAELAKVETLFNTFFATPKNGQGAFNAGALRAFPSPSPVRSVPAPIDDEFCAQADLPPLTEAQGREYELNEMREGRANRYERGFLVD